MLLPRRQFLALAGGTAAFLSQSMQAPAQEAPAAAATADLGDWGNVRAQFALSDEYVHMSAMLLASHPRPVREAIDEHRKGLDADPVGYLGRNGGRLLRAARAAAGDHLGTNSSDIALTDSTTMGVGLVYNGIQLRPGQEMLTTEQDYYVTHEAIRLAALRTGSNARRISLYDRIDGVSEEQIVDQIRAAIQPATRVLGLTWVHSSTGLKLPIRAITAMVAEINASRDEADRVLVCVDGVHGFGNQNVTFDDLGCDFLMAGCHKWLFGPRGTGIVAGTRRGWEAVLPTIPSFIDDRTWNAWLSGEELDGPSTASRMTPGGFKAFEHQWALTEAFAFNEAIGKARIAERTRQLADQLKEALSGMSHVRLLTPRSEALSAGIVAFDVEGFSAAAAVRRLRERRIIASASPYAVPHVRLTPSIVNTPEEVDAAAREILELA